MARFCREKKSRTCDTSGCSPPRVEHFRLSEFDCVNGTERFLFSSCRYRQRANYSRERTQQSQSRMFNASTTWWSGAVTHPRGSPRRPEPPRLESIAQWLVGPGRMGEIQRFRSYRKAQLKQEIDNGAKRKRGITEWREFN